MQGLHRLVAVAVLAAWATLGTAGMAVAQYAPAAAIACDTSTVLPGEAFTCTAGGFRGGSRVLVTAAGATAGATVRVAAAAGQWTHETTVTAGGGVAEAVVQVPGNATGPASVTFAGVAPDGQRRVLSSTAVTVAPAPGADVVAAPAPAAGADPAMPAPPLAGDDLPATGSDLVPWLLAVLAFVGVGGGLVLAGRRRQRPHGDA